MNARVWLVAFAAAALPVLAVSPAPVRVLIAVVLTGLAPGYSLVRLLAITDRLVVAVSAVAASLAVTALTSMSLGYIEAWSWPSCAGLLVAVTIGGAVVDTGRVPK